MRKAKKKRLIGIFRIYNLRKKLLIHLFSIILVMVAMGIYSIYAVGSGEIADEISGEIAGLLPESHNSGFDARIVEDALARAQFRMAVFMAVCLLGVFGVLMLFIRNIVGPLNGIVEATKKMADGDLRETVPVQTEDEIGEIGNMINDLLANFQEILLDVWNGTTHSKRLLKEIDKSIRSRSCNCISPKLQKEIEFLQRHSEDMQAIIHTFDLYEVHLEEDKVKSGPQPDIEWD